MQQPWFDWPGTPENTGQRLREMAQAADSNGFSTLWLMDHFYQVGQGFGPKGDPMLEGYTTLSHLAAVTREIKLGLLVTGSFYRPPGLLVKMVTTLDVLSGGRAILGLGAGWDELESRAFGIPFPPTREKASAADRLFSFAVSRARANCGSPRSGSSHGSRAIVRGAQNPLSTTEASERSALSTSPTRARHRA